MMEHTMENIVEAKNINKTFDVRAEKVPVLKGIDLEIKKGEFVVITGPSGCGKSTLLHIILGLETPTSGTLSFHGHNLYGGMDEDDRTEIRKKEVGMIYQQPNWIKALTVVENVMFALRINGESDEQSHRKSLAMLEKVGMDKWQEYIPTELSSGQQQKVALARALVTNPEVVIADEPTGNLDFKSGQELMNLLKDMRGEGRTVIMVTHDLEYLKFATRSIIMFDGKIVGEAHGNELSDKIEGFKKLIAAVSKQ